MVARFAIVIATLVAASPAFSQTMNADAARRFVVGKMFAFNCFDGSRGAGRIYGDGSVIGTMQSSASGPARSMWMPAGTLRVKGDSVCAAVKGMCSSRASRSPVRATTASAAPSRGWASPIVTSPGATWSPA